MKNTLIVTVTLFALGVFTFIAQAADMKEALDGKTEFENHCGSCHPNGGNKVNPAKPLYKATLEQNGIKTWKDGVAKMRNPGPGMTKFLKEDISDQEAKVITNYILATFQY